MAPPINVQDWYGDRHTCQIASGALAPLIHISGYAPAHFRTRPSHRPYLAPTKISRRHLKRFKSYIVFTNKYTNGSAQVYHSTTTTSLCYRCTGHWW